MANKQDTIYQPIKDSPIRDTDRLINICGFRIWANINHANATTKNKQNDNKLSVTEYRVENSA